MEKCPVDCCPAGMLLKSAFTTLRSTPFDSMFSRLQLGSRSHMHTLQQPQSCSMNRQQLPRQLQNTCGPPHVASRSGAISTRQHSLQVRPAVLLH